MTTLAILTTALLFGGMVLYSFSFAAFMFHVLPAELAGTVIRRAFSYFYLFVLFISALGAVFVFPKDGVATIILASIAASTIYARQVLMPAINVATDTKDKTRFKMLHSLSVVITLLHIAGAGYVLVYLARLPT